VAQKMLVILEDDIDGGAAQETITFALDGTTYEIDLNAANAAALRDAFAPFVGAARKAGRGRGPSVSRPRRASAGRPADLTAVREWARSNGHQVSDRGRISAAVQKAYDAAH
jgi:hypothetical protein